MVQFRLLGTVQLSVAGREINLGHGRQRTVLAALLADATRPVPIDELIYRVWGDEPPGAARSGLYSYVTRLRRVLAVAAEKGGTPVHLRSEQGGYLLDVEPDLVDMHRFRRLVRNARADEARRVELLDEAAGLWRGEPLAGLSGAWVHRLRQALAHERLDAAVLRARSRLRLERAEPVISELRALLVQHPLAEPVIACLMEALAQEGRRSEALELYATSRRLIRDELGVEPGPQLQRRHQLLLSEDRPVPNLRPTAGPISDRQSRPPHEQASRATAAEPHPTHRGPPAIADRSHGGIDSARHTRRAILRYAALGGVAAAGIGFCAGAAAIGLAGLVAGAASKRAADVDPRLNAILGAADATSAALIPARDHSFQPLPEHELGYPIEVDCLTAYTQCLWPAITLRPVRGYPQVRPDDTLVLFGSQLSNLAARRHLGNPFDQDVTRYAVYGDPNRPLTVPLRWNITSPPGTPMSTRKQYGGAWTAQEHRLVDLLTGSDVVPGNQANGDTWDYFVVTAVPRFASGPQRVIIFGGVHGQGTHGIATWLRTSVLADLAVLATRTKHSPYFQALFEVKLRHDQGEATPTAVTLVDAVPLDV